MQSTSVTQLQSGLESKRSEVTLQDLNLQSPNPLGATGGPLPTEGVVPVGSQLSRENLVRDVSPSDRVNDGSQLNYQGLNGGNPTHQGVICDGVSYPPGFMGGAHTSSGHGNGWVSIPASTASTAFIAKLASLTAQYSAPE